MPQSGFTPVQLYRSSTAAAVPSAGNLQDGELALNFRDGILYYKDHVGVVQTLASAFGVTPVSRGGTGQSSLTSGAILRGNGTGAVTASLFSESGSTMSLFGNMLFASSTPTLTFNTGGPVVASPATGTLTISTSGVERVRITNTGLVGIGTTTPSEALSVQGNISTSGTLLTASPVPVTSGGTGVAAVASGAILRGNGTSAMSVSLFSESGSTMSLFGDLLFASPTPTLTFNVGGPTLFSPAASTLAISTSATERVRVTNIGRVGIGTAAPTEILHVIGNILASGSITAFSDASLKEDVRTIDKALDKVLHMRGVSFRRKDTGEAGVGVIAQEAVCVLPEVVFSSGELLTVAYGNIVGVLIEAIKELNAKIEHLEAARNRFDNTISQMEG